MNALSSALQTAAVPRARRGDVTPQHLRNVNVPPDALASLMHRREQQSLPFETREFTKRLQPHACSVKLCLCTVSTNVAELWAAFAKHTFDAMIVPMSIEHR